MTTAMSAVTVIGLPADELPPDCEFATDEEFRRWLLDWETGRDQPEPHQVQAR